MVFRSSHDQHEGRIVLSFSRVLTIRNVDQGLVFVCQNSRTRDLELNLKFIKKNENGGKSHLLHQGIGKVVGGIRGDQIFDIFDRVGKFTRDQDDTSIFTNHSHSESVLRETLANEGRHGVQSQSEEVS